MKSNGNGKRKPRKLPEVLTADEQGRLLALLQPADTPERVRAVAMLRLFLDTGLRSAELINLKIRDIDWEAGRLKVVNGKGGKDRIIGISDADLALLRDWLNYRHSSSIQPKNFLFTSLDGLRPVCGRWLRRMIKNLAKKAGVEKDIHLHSLRHSFASDYLRKCNNLFKVAQALGHASLETTQIYLHLNPDELVEDMKNLRNGGGTT